MDGIKKTKRESELTTIYYEKNGKVVKRNEYACIKEQEEIMAMVSKLSGYQRSEQLAMYIHEFYALVNFLNEKK